MFNYVNGDLDIAHKFDQGVPAQSPDYSKHYHDFYEIYFFVRGSIAYTVEEEKQQIQPYSLLFIQPGEHHFVTFLSDEPYERYVLKFQENLVPEFLKTFFIKNSAFYSDTENLRSLFERLDEWHNKYDRTELKWLFPCIITELLISLYHSGHHDKMPNPDNTVTAIIQYINENIRLPLSAQDLCEQFHFSQSYLYNEFHTHMKIPIMKYIRTKKIIAANQMIARGEKPTKVSEDFGYLDYTTFYRAFISVMNYPPSRNNKPKPE